MSTTDTTTTPATATTIPTETRKSITYPIKTWINNTASQKSTIVHMVSYMTIGTFTLITISSLFCLFLAVSFMDDCIKVVAPDRLITRIKNQIDWTALKDRISHQLTNFAQWEKNKRNSWYPENHPIYHEDRFHN